MGNRLMENIPQLIPIYKSIKSVSKTIHPPSQSVDSQWVIKVNDLGSTNDIPLATDTELCSYAE